MADDLRSGAETAQTTALIDDLVAGSRILAAQGVVDGFGHVSVRAADGADQFLISRSLAPAMVTARDIMAVDLDGRPIDDDRPAFVERFIHAAIYAARPDVAAIVHSHSPSVIPFGVVAGSTLRPIYHMSAFLADAAPVFEIRDVAGSASDMLIRDLPLGQALAHRLGGASAILMRGHGSVAVGGSLRQAVYRGIYLEISARIQLQATSLGEITFLTIEEAAAADLAGSSQIDRAWALWRSQI